MKLKPNANMTIVAFLGKKINKNTKLVIKMLTKNKKMQKMISPQIKMINILEVTARLKKRFACQNEKWKKRENSKG